MISQNPLQATLELWKAEQRARGELKKEEETESCLTPVVLLDKDADSELPQELRLSSVVDFNWQDPKKSQVLGKHFKPNLHFRPPALKPVVNMDVVSYTHLTLPTSVYV